MKIYKIAKGSLIDIRDLNAFTNHIFALSNSHIQKGNNLLGFLHNIVPLERIINTPSSCNLDYD